MSPEADSPNSKIAMHGFMYRNSLQQIGKEELYRCYTTHDFLYKIVLYKDHNDADIIDLLYISKGDSVAFY